MYSEKTAETYLAILQEELVKATGCTEPIAIAYCAALLRETLGMIPTEIQAEVSGNILKNVKSVVVPNTGGLKGLPAAVAAGIVAGQAEKKLQVIADVAAEKHGEIAKYLKETPIDISCMDTSCMLDIRLTGCCEAHTAVVRIANHHTNVVYRALDGQVLEQHPITASAEDHLQDKSALNVADIVTFVEAVDINRLIPILRPQADCNSSIAERGLQEDWGAGVGITMLSAFGKDNILVEAAAYAAAGSDARMSGCEQPVVILSGSGNQGITASLPVIRYANYLGVSEERMYRALALSDLVAIHQKTGIGRLSAYCGAISAGVGAGSGIAWLRGADTVGINHTIVNAVAILSGTVCDGAKPSCAAKIFSAVTAGIMGYELYLRKKEFYNGDGIVGESVEATIVNVGRMAREGMRQTDRTILEIMTGH